jgi:hypothetical protein
MQVSGSSASAAHTLTLGVHLKPAKRGLPAEVKDVFIRFGMLLLLLANVVLDLGFLVGWVVANHYGEVLLHKWHVEDQFSFVVLQWCFRVSTLVPIIAFVVADFVRIARRFLKQISGSTTGG